MPPKVVPLNAASWDRAEIDAVVEVLEKGRNLRMGRRTRLFEERVAALLGKRSGIMVNSGSSALELAVRLIRLQPGSEVVTTPLCFSTDVAPLVRAQLVPAFVDVEPGTCCIDVARIEEMIGERTGALLVPDLVGNVPDWDRIREIGERHGLLLVEDSCDTLGARLRGRPPGERADLSVTSFNQSHIVTCAGTGGLLAVDDPELEVQARLARNWGRSSSRHGSGPRDFEGDLEDATLDGIPYHRDFVFESLGYNFEAAEILAAFGLAQLDKLEHFAAARARWVERHARFFSDHEDRFVLPRQLPELETTWQCYPIVVRPDAGFARNELHRFLEERGVVSRPIWTGNILRHPGFRDIECRRARGGYPVADEVMAGGLLVACHHALDEADVDRIHEVFDQFLGRH